MTHPAGLRLLGVGRNQYIDLMNQYRSRVGLVILVVAEIHMCNFVPEIFPPSQHQGFAARTTSEECQNRAVVAGSCGLHYRG